MACFVFFCAACVYMYIFGMTCGSYHKRGPVGLICTMRCCVCVCVCVCVYVCVCIKLNSNGLLVNSSVDLFIDTVSNFPLLL